MYNKVSISYSMHWAWSAIITFVTFSLRRTEVMSTGLTVWASTAPWWRMAQSIPVQSSLHQNRFSTHTGWKMQAIVFLFWCFLQIPRRHQPLHCIINPRQSCQVVLSACRDLLRLGGWSQLQRQLFGKYLKIYTWFPNISGPAWLFIITYKIRIITGSTER